MKTHCEETEVTAVFYLTVIGCSTQVKNAEFITAQILNSFGVQNFSAQIPFYKIHSLIKALLIIHPANIIIYLRILKKKKKKNYSC